jgi:8-oxo-dGTP pyrophosphatase MutT (NUDIX family)
MPRIVTEAEARLLDPAFFEKDRGKHAWIRRNDDMGFESENYGGIALLYVVKDDGTIDHNRGVAWEPKKGTVNGSPWYPEDGIYYIGILEQVRPFALNADGTESDSGIVFAQPVMAFRTRLLGEQIAAAVDTGQKTVEREALEEAGIRRIVNVRSYGDHWPNPTFIRSATEVWDLQVDPASITGEVDSAEFILNFSFITVGELVRRIQLGEYEGVNYRAAIALSTWMIWMSNHPEAAVQAYQSLIPSEGE